MNIGKGWKWYCKCSSNVVKIRFRFTFYLTLSKHSARKAAHIKIRFFLHGIGFLFSIFILCLLICTYILLFFIFCIHFGMLKVSHFQFGTLLLCRASSLRVSKRVPGGRHASMFLLYTYIIFKEKPWTGIKLVNL